MKAVDEGGYFGLFFKCQIKVTFEMDELRRVFNIATRERMREKNVSSAAGLRNGIGRERLDDFYRPGSKFFRCEFDLDRLRLGYGH